MVWMGEGIAVEQLLRRHSRNRVEHMPLSNNWPGSHPIDGRWIRHLTDPEPAMKPLPRFLDLFPSGAERDRSRGIGQRSKLVKHNLKS